jgi:hypothetical protein
MCERELGHIMSSDCVAVHLRISLAQTCSLQPAARCHDRARTACYPREARSSTIPP